MSVTHLGLGASRSDAGRAAPWGGEGAIYTHKHTHKLLKPGGPSTFGCDELERNVSVDG